MKAVGFDALAGAYDDIFTRSAIGIRQRASVWDYLDKHIPNWVNANVLDIGCGTGEDVIQFLKRGVAKVSAFDPALNMVTLAKQKVHDASSDGQVSLSRSTLAGWLKTRPDLTKLDLVFSNFGALNMVAPKDLEQMAAYCYQHLPVGSDLVLVLMPTFCIWETLYFLGKGQWKTAFRRQNSPIEVHLKSSTLQTWYYHPSTIEQFFSKFELVSKKGIGICIPPSYLSDHFKSRERVLDLLSKLERSLAKMPLSASNSDHFLIHLKK